MLQTGRQHEVHQRRHGLTVRKIAGNGADFTVRCINLFSDDR